MAHVDAVMMINNDLKYVDGVFSATLKRNSTHRIDPTTLAIAVEGTTIPLPTCLFRNSAYRNDNSTKQVTKNGVSIQQDLISSSDRVAEVQKFPDLVIKDGDVFIHNATKEEFTVIAVDDCALGTRYRVGLKRIQ